MQKAGEVVDWPGVKGYDRQGFSPSFGDCGSLFRREEANAKTRDALLWSCNEAASSPMEVEVASSS